MNLDYTIFKNFHKNKDIKFYTYSNCPISSRIKNNVFWEKHLHDIFEKFINEESIVIEGGCHIGTHTLKMALICKHIYAFEPFPASFDLLNSNVKINNLDNVSIIKKGLSNSKNIVQFGWIPERNPGASGLTENPMGLPGTNTLKSKPIDVQLTTIDDLKLEKLDFIKLDIEGYEQFAIMGGLETIKKFKPVITLESWLNHKGQININETKKRYVNLIDLGYEFHHIWGPDFLFIPK